MSDDRAVVRFLKLAKDAKAALARPKIAAMIDADPELRETHRRVLAALEVLEDHFGRLA